MVLINNDLDAIDGDEEDWASGRLPDEPKKRVFCHWVLIDLPQHMAEIGRGAFSNAVVAGGKLGPDCIGGTRQGLNDYTYHFRTRSLFQGQYFGYDGPCPPPGAKPHRYEFTIYALDVERLAIAGVFSKDDVFKAMEGHVIADATITGLF